MTNILLFSATLLAYTLGLWIYETKRRVWLHPILVSLLILIAILEFFDIQYQHYAEANELLTFMLGPVTVALAIPMVKQLKIIRRNWRVVLTVLAASSVLIVMAAIGLALIFAADDALLLSLSTKSITGAIAYLVAEAMGGYGGLAAVIVLITGVYGVVIAKPVFKLCNITDEAAQGFALGIAAHAVGTAYAFELSPKCGAFAALGLSLNGLFTAMLLPVAVVWFIG